MEYTGPDDWKLVHKLYKRNFDAHFCFHNSEGGLDRFRSIFMSKSKSRVIQLKQELRRMINGSLSIHEYALRLRELSDKFESSG